MKEITREGIERSDDDILGDEKYSGRRIVVIGIRTEKIGMSEAVIDDSDPDNVVVIVESHPIFDTYKLVEHEVEGFVLPDHILSVTEEIEELKRGIHEIKARVSNLESVGL